MKLFEVTGSFDPLLMRFWKNAGDELVQRYATRGGCGAAARDFLEFLEAQGIMTAEMIPAGRIVKGAKKQGWFYTDIPDTDMDAFTREDLMRMKYQGLDPRKRKDRLSYIKNNGLEEEFRWIPHAWVEIRDRILDPSGFLPNGGGGFDGMVKEKTGLHRRYQYFK